LGLAIHKVIVRGILAIGEDFAVKIATLFGASIRIV
jgi:hypothetical protein